MGRNKGPRIGQSPGNPEIRAQTMPDWNSLPIAWQFQHLDTAGPFGWHTCNQDTLLKKIWASIRSYETMLWRDIPKKRLHGIAVSLLSKEARKRLEELQQIDIPELHCLRIEGKPRIWGIRDRLYFKVLWWDPEHKVYPVNFTDN